MNRRSKLCLGFAAVALVGAVALLTVPLHAKTSNVVMANNTIRGGNACGSLYAHPPPTYQMRSSFRVPGQDPAWPSDPCSARRSTAWWEVGALVVLTLVLAAAAAVPRARLG